MILLFRTVMVNVRNASINGIIAKEQSIYDRKLKWKEFFARKYQSLKLYQYVYNF